MKKVIFYSVLASVLTSCISVSYLYTPVVQLNGNLRDYTYVYVVPTSPVVSSSGISVNMSAVANRRTNRLTSRVLGAPINTVTPSEIISGYMMKKGYTPLPSLSDELANETLVISYGYTGRRKMGPSYASVVVIQMRNAKTHQLVASCESEGCGRDETDDILQAVQSGLKAIFKDEDQPKEEQSQEDTYFIFD